MRITFKKIIKAFVPYGVLWIWRNYKKFKTVEYKIKGDIILSVGCACRPAYFLREHGLRYCASPIDWMMRYSLKTVVHLFETEFSDFFIDVSLNETESIRTNCRWFEDNRNHITSLHYNNIDIENDIFREKMLRRYNRIHNILRNSKRIIFISNRNENADVFIDFIQKMQRIYPTNIVYINIRSDKDMNDIKHSEKRVGKGLKIIEYKFKDIHKDGDDRRTNRNFWLGNVEEWDKIMNLISVKKR